MLRRLGLRQRIIALFVAGALVMTGIVGLSLYEFSALQKYSEDERAAELRSDEIHAVVLVALQTATTFSSLGFDLTSEEKKYTLAEGEALLSQLEVRQEQIAPIIKSIVSPEHQQALIYAVSEIRRSWEEIKADIQQDGQDIFRFHLLSVVKYTARVREIIAEADASAKGSAKIAADALDRRAELARGNILLALFAGLAGVLVVGWVVLHYGVRRPFG